MVDSMATFFVVGGVHLLSRVTDASPRFYVETADGDKPVTAIGDILIWLPFRDGSWQCYEVHNVLVLPNCSIPRGTCAITLVSSMTSTTA